jgi:predicted O-methyltransferase YrrM
MGRLAVVSAADAKFFDLLQGTVRSLRDKPQGRNVALYVFDIGLSEAQRRWLLTQGAALHVPQDPLASTPVLHAFLSRSRIPELFPGHDVYLWIDADAWVQRWDAIEAYVEGALRAGFAITPETDAAYTYEAYADSVRRAGWVPFEVDSAYPRDAALNILLGGASFAMFGDEYLEQLRTTGSVNAGVFAGRADAPHWQAWRQMIEANIHKADTPRLLFLLDQTALCIVCWQEGFETALLPATCNWICDHALPMTSDDGALLVRPLPPHEPLGIVHQTFATKRAFFSLSRLGGGCGSLSRTLSYQAHSQLAADEYVSPGLQVVLLDQCFPNMVRGDQSASTWRYLRRGLPHAWMVDRRVPSWGFLNRDEAHILYNLALGFHGKRALEIGCLMGWSACHLALAGLDLDIIDPLLENPEVLASVQASLQASRSPGRVNLIAGRSPAAVHGIAKTNPQGWSLFFIDGDHEGDAPLNDVKACQPYAAADCAMMFHDLASPDVTNAVLHLKAQGWKTRVYHTAQIMAVAWRGHVDPVAHQPDPRIDWQIPDHVMPLLA